MSSPYRTAARRLHWPFLRHARPLLLLLVFSLAYPALAAGTAQSRVADPPQHADFAGEPASAEARRVADWIVGSNDNRDLPFLVVDKINAKLFLFNPDGAIRAATPVLLGLARGDVSPPGIGDLPLSRIKPADRITPAGRFIAAKGRNLAGQDIVWVDYAAAISLHRATDAKPGLTARSRRDRLSTQTVQDNRISHGCINVSVKFYDRFIRTTFAETMAIVYILPELESARAEFNIPV